ncbi:MAG TPA: hypothetical protein GXX69_07325 [Firmicutes bacterium]|nr:hypothetical protein [Bacillota bacterium]
MQPSSQKVSGITKMLLVTTAAVILALIIVSTYRGHSQKAKLTPVQHEAGLIQEPDKSEPIKKPEELEEGEIPINTVEELAKIGHDSAYPRNGTYYLMSDLDLFGVGGEEGWVPIGFSKDQDQYSMDTRLSFIGTFDGNGCVIRNLQINRPETDCLGLFGRIGPGAELMNIKLEDVNISGRDCIGGLTGQNYEGTISSCYSTGTVTGKLRTSGLVGRNWGTITDSYFIGDVTGKLSTGGLVGANHNSVTDSYFSGTVTGELNTGGLVGLDSGGSTQIENSHCTGTVTGKKGTGGLVGSTDGLVAASYFSGTVSGIDGTGGLVGVNGGSVTNSSCTGDVGGRSSTGGLVGFNRGSIANTYSTGFVTGNGLYTGGLVGSNFGCISSSYSTGSVSGQNDTGGLAGLNSGTDAKIENTYSIGNVTGKINTGGLVGYNWSSTVTNSYSTGTVTGEDSTGGLVGLKKGWKDPGTGTIHYATLTDCYYLETVSPFAVGSQEFYSSISNEASIKQSSADLKKQSTFNNWDFGTVWAIDENKSYPYLIDNKQVPRPESK